jgi:hypothetical protein
VAVVGRPIHAAPREAAVPGRPLFFHKRKVPVRLLLWKKGKKGFLLMEKVIWRKRDLTQISNERSKFK